MLRPFLFAILVVLFLGSCVSSGGPQSVERIAQGVTFKLLMDPVGGLYRCGGTAIGPSALLTAEHCLKRTPGDSILVGGIPATIDRVVLDGMDHAVIIFKDRQFDRWAAIAEPPIVGDEVFIWGNAMIDSFLRRGYVATFVWNEPWRDWPIGTGWMVIDMRGAGGDSGSGVFNKRGQLVAVLTGGLMPAPDTPPSFSVSLPLAFDKEAVKRHAPGARHLSR